jgi:hypothetical protein
MFAQFLVRFNLRVELWGCAVLNILPSGVQRLPKGPFSMRSSITSAKAPPAAPTSF